MQEREMTKKDKAKEKRLKKKYDDSDMKASMKKQYGDDWKNVYYATIRKKAMEDIKEAEENSYTVVHAKHGKEVIKATSSYGAAKKYADMKKLKSTAGVDAHLMEGYYEMPSIDRERYTEMPGLEGPFQTRSGKTVYYDPKEGAYYDRDTDMYMTYDEFKDLDDVDPMRKKAESVVNNLKKQLEGNSPHKKGTKKYKAHMAAMHANEDVNQQYADVLKSKNQIKINAFLQGLDSATATRLTGGQAQTSKISSDGQSIGPSGDAYTHGKPGLSKQTIRMTKPVADRKYGESKGNMIETKKEKTKTVTLEQMRTALQLDEDTAPIDIVSQYVKTTLDETFDTWPKVRKQVDYILSRVNDTRAVNGDQVFDKVFRENLQSQLDEQVIVSESIDTLRDIVNNKSAMTVKFQDGTMKVDMTTASIFLQAYDKMKDRNQEKISEMMRTKKGFLRVLDFIYGAMQ